MNARTLTALLRKELLMMKRNPIVPRLIVAMPVLVMLIIPLVATLDVKDVGVAVVDNDRTELSRRMVADMEASEYLHVTGCYARHDEALRQMENGRADVIVSIPEDYQKDWTTGKKPRLAVEANGVDAMKGTLGAQYATRSVTHSLTQWQAERGIGLPAAESSTMNLYNPTLNFRNYMIPALMVVLLIIVCGFLPTLNLVGEKEAGTIEAMNVTPVGKLEFVLSKLIPYWAVGLLIVTVGMLIGWLVYGLVPEGSVGSIYLAAILFSLVMSGVMFAFIVVFQLMGGLFTPIASMPRWAQGITYALPPRYFIEIMRTVYLKGATPADLAVQYAALAGFALLLSLAAAATYRRRD